MASDVTGPVYSTSAPPFGGKKRNLGKTLSISPWDRPTTPWNFSFFLQKKPSPFDNLLA